MFTTCHKMLKEEKNKIKKVKNKGKITNTSGTLSYKEYINKS